MRPLPAPQGDTVPAVVRARLRLTKGGAGKSLATKAPQPATLVFTLGTIEQVRPPEKRTDSAWLKIAGQIVLVGDDQVPRFTIGSNPVTLDDPSLSAAPDPSKPQRPSRSFFFEFDDASFVAAGPLKVPLPEIANEVRHIEIQVELQIAGATESSKAMNDVLDKPVLKQLIHVSPRLCLDTPMADAAEHNLAFLLGVTGDRIDVESLHLGDDALVEGEQFFQTDGQVYFRPIAKPVAPLPGVLITTDGREFEFELGVAKTLRERMNSLALQLSNMNGFAEGAANQARQNGVEEDEASRVRDVLLVEALDRKGRLLDSIEGTLNDNHEFAAFYARAATLPAVRDDAGSDELA